MKITMKAARVNAGMSQKEAADGIGINPSTLHRWESGSIVPKASKLEELCKLYGCTIDCIKIVGGETE